MDIINRELSIILSLTPQTQVNLDSLRRDLLEIGLTEKYPCGNFMSAVQTILTEAILDNSIDGESSPSIAKWFTDLIVIGAPSVEGIAFKGGIRYIGDTIVVKISKNPKSSSLFHEYFIGFFLNRLRYDIPNFMYVFGGFECGSPAIQNLKIEKLCQKPGTVKYLVTEMIKGETLKEKIAQHTITKDELFSCTFQILLALQIAQEKFQYCHYDLHTSNIIVRTLREKKNIQYLEYYWITTDCIATIIDYGYSSITYENERYGIVNKPKYGIDDQFKPGIDVYRFLYNIFVDIITYRVSMDLVVDYLNTFKPFLFLIANDSTKQLLNNNILASRDINKQNYYYPSLGDVGIYKITPINLIMSINLSTLSKYLLSEPKKGFVNLTDNCADDDLNTILKNLTTPSLENKPCKDDNWETLPGHWKDKYGKSRYWFDCGKFMYDGTFNVITFPKGMSLYHGSPALTYFAGEYPLGPDYYKPGVDPLTNFQKELLKAGDIPIENKLNLLKTKQPINISYYGDYEVAMIYSKIPIKLEGKDPFVFKCGINCVSAYKLLKDINMVNLYDPFNLYILLTENYLKDEAKEILANAYDINTVNNFIDLYEKIKPGSVDTQQDAFQQLQRAYDPFRRFILKSRRGTLRKQGYLVPREILTVINKLGYTGFVNPRSPYLEGTLKGSYRFAELVFGTNVLEFVERDFNNPHDWQYFDIKRLFGEIGVLVKDMYKYKSLNIDFHAGDLYEHSVWTALYVQKMFKIGSTWVEGIDSYFMPILIISGFLHDIGKGGDLVYTYYDKPDHPLVGYEYFIQIRVYLYRDENNEIQTLDITKLLENLNILDENMENLVSFLILSHWEFGHFISQMTGNNTEEVAMAYMSTLDRMIEESYVNLPKYLLYRMAMLISACDIMASQVYIPREKFKELSNDINNNPNLVVNNLNAYLDDYPYLTNRPKTHRGSNKYEEFKIEQKGLKIREFMVLTEMRD